MDMEVSEMDNGEILQRGIEDFRSLSKKENATETYARLKKKYISLKVLLNSLGVNLTEFDEIKE